MTILTVFLQMLALLVMISAGVIAHVDIYGEAEA